MNLVLLMSIYNDWPSAVHLIRDTDRALAALAGRRDGEDRPEDVDRLLRALEAAPTPRVVFAERRKRSEGIRSCASLTEPWLR